MILSGIDHAMDHRWCFALSRSKACGADSRNVQDGFARFCIRIATAAGDIASVVLHTEDKYLHYWCEERLAIPEEQRPQAPEGFPFYGRWSTANAYPMRKIASDDVHDYFEVQIDINTICLRYYFELTDTEGRTIYYADFEFTDSEPADPEHMFDCPQQLREDMLFDTPDWAHNAVLYQVFPTAFAAADGKPLPQAPCNGDELHSQAVDARTRLSASAALNPQWYQVPADGWMNLHGTLRGVMEALPHIQELGANAIYLNPIFVSPVTPHKYDTYDYLHVEPSIGTDEELVELVCMAHARGIRVILDGVFNHTSREFFAFKDVVEKGPDSAYWNWYGTNDYPLTMPGEPGAGVLPDYQTFGYFGYMPKLNTANPDVQDYFITVATHWITVADIDGWRMDVADEVNHVFWKRLRAAVRAVKPDAIIGAEVWHTAFDSLEGDEWDTVMNYHFLKAVKRFIATSEFTATDYVNAMGFMRGRLHPAAWNVMWNLLDSHDTPRFRHVCGDDDGKYQLAVAMQLLSAGMPMIYYGDEYGLTGADDPDCRRGMVWDKAHQIPGMYEWFTRLVTVRREIPGVLDGQVLSVTADDARGLIVITKSLVAKECDASFVESARGVETAKNVVRHHDGDPTVTIIYHNRKESDHIDGFDGTFDNLTSRRFDGTLAPYQALVLTGGAQ